MLLEDTERYYGILCVPPDGTSIQNTTASPPFVSPKPRHWLQNQISWNSSPLAACNTMFMSVTIVQVIGKVMPTTAKYVFIVCHRCTAEIWAAQNLCDHNDQQIETVLSVVCIVAMAEWQTCFSMSIDQGLCQELKALWEIHYLQWNWSQGSNMPSFCTHSTGVSLHFHITSNLRFNIIKIDAKPRKCYI